MTRPKLTTDAIDTQIRELWRKVDKLLEEAKGKEDFIRGLAKDRMLPCMTTDAPREEWHCIMEQLRAIDVLKNVKRTLDREVRQKREARKKVA